MITDNTIKELLAISPAALFCCQADDIYLNDPAIALTGYRNEDFIGSAHWWSLFSPPPSPRQLEHPQQARLQIKGGRELVVELFGRRQGEYEIWALHDITRCVKMEAEVRDSQNRLAGIIDSAMDAIITVDNKQQIILFNKAAEEVFGYPAEEALGQNLNVFIPERYRQAHHEHIHRFERTGISNRRMSRYGSVVGLRANGQEFPMEAAISQVKVGDQVLHTVILRDVSERKRLEEEVRRVQEERLSRKNEELIESYKKAEVIFSALAEILPGTVLDGKYRLEEKIGTGGYGVVYRAVHLGLTRAVAVKIFRPVAAGENQENLTRFRLEGVSACRVNHSHAVSILDAGVSNEGIVYLVMELLDGWTLTEELNRNSTFSVQRTLEILIPICQVLAEAHRAGIVHRDVKPDNIFLHHIGGEQIVKVVDFGIAKFLDKSSGMIDLNNLTVKGLILGTPVYMSPERLSSKPYDGRSDVYSVGIMFYQMINGDPPFDPAFNGLFALAMMHLNTLPPPISDTDPDVPPEIEALIMRTLAKDPDKRPTAQELATELTNLLNTLPEEKLQHRCIMCRFTPSSSQTVEVKKL
jgi:PAS domain S-box-containing protein